MVFLTFILLLCLGTEHDVPFETNVLPNSEDSEHASKRIKNVVVTVMNPNLDVEPYISNYKGTAMV
jgi:hypothetical protein